MRRLGHLEGSRNNRYRGFADPLGRERVALIESLEASLEKEADGIQQGGELVAIESIVCLSD